MIGLTEERIVVASASELDAVIGLATAQMLDETKGEIDPFINADGQYTNSFNSVTDRIGENICKAVDENRIAIGVVTDAFRRYQTDRHTIESEVTPASARNPEAILRLHVGERSGWVALQLIDIPA